MVKSPNKIVEFTAEFSGGRFFKFQLPALAIRAGDHMVRPYAEDLQRSGELP
jgi:hypothetical protein